MLRIWDRLVPIAGVVCMFAVAPAGAWAGVSFGTPHSTGLGPTVTGPVVIAPATFRPGGAPDVAVAALDAGALFALLGDGAGTFAVGLPIAATKPSGVATGDVNADGNADVAVVESSSDTLRLRLGDGSGGSSDATGSPYPAGAGALAVAIVTGDAQASVAVTTTAGVSVRGWDPATHQLLGAVDYLTSSAPSAIVAADVNGDGHADLVAALPGSDGVAVLLNNGSGGFGAAANVTTGAGSAPRSVAVADITGDIRADIVARSPSTHQIVVLVGDGSGGFGAPIPSADGLTGASPSAALAAADFDGDGHADVAVADEPGAAVTVLSGAADGHVAIAGAFAAGGTPVALTTADVNRDGKPDLVAGIDGAPSAVATLLNTTAASPAPSPKAAVLLVRQPPRPVPGSVLLDATPLDGANRASAHGGIVDYRWDLNGDGTYERDTRALAAVAIVYGQPGDHTVGLRVAYHDATTATFTQVVPVAQGATSRGCGVYCHVTFPLHAPGSGSTGAGCVSTLQFGVVEARGDCLVRQPDGTYVTDQQVRVNGFDITPGTGRQIVLDPAHFTISSGGHQVGVQMGEVPIGFDVINWTGLDGDSSHRATLPPLLLVPGVDAALEGFPFVGRMSPVFYDSGSPRLGTHDYRASIGAFVMLPDFIGGVSVALSLSTDNDNGLALDELHVHLTDATIKALPIKELDIDYNGPAGLWGGALRIPIGSYEVQAGVGLRPVDPAEPNGNLTLDHLSAALGGLNVSIYAGIFLQEIRAGFTLAPPADSFTGGITLSEGPKVRDISLIQLMGDFTVTFGDPLDFNLAAELDVFSFKVATAVIDYRTDGNLTLVAHVRLPYWDDGQPVPVARLQADVDGWVDGPHNTFNAEGGAHLCLGVCLGASAIVSSVGAAGCVDVGFGDVGAGYTWSTRTLAGFGGFGGSCDLGPWRASHARAWSAQAGQSFIVPAGQKLAAFQVSGRDAPPLVTLTGPHGQTVTTPADALGAKAQNAWIYKDPATKTTNVAVFGNDIVGTWRAAAVAGSTPVVSATSALSRPPIRARATIGGRGRTRTLRYVVTRNPGETITFAEQGKHAARVLGRATAARGTLHFTSGNGPAGRRTIVALVAEAHGLPRRAITVAHYVTPGTARPGRIRTIGFTRSRSRTTLRVSWTAARGAHTYDVLVTTINHRRQLFTATAKRRALVLTDVKRGDHVSVTITPRGRYRLAGRAKRRVAVIRT